MQVTYDGSFNENVLPIVKERLEPFLGHFPDWVQNLVVFYQTDSAQGLTMSCMPNYHYRFVHFNIYPHFLDDIYWDVSIMHEIIHAYAAPHANKVDSIIESLELNDGLKQYFLNELEEENEAVTQDLAKLFSKLLKNSAKKFDK